MIKSLANIIVIFGLILVGIGLLLKIAGKISWIGRLPGDILIKKENFTFYFPLTTSIIISILLSLFLYIFFKIFFKK
ncbi:DUF2905 domain-containing protein [Candidatus Aminicenantes bacterium AC-335-A11]|jgi:hypothetical protein|nr:DUF2905 domain-containing protein [SCandidatus Aminicenantes bacterium Aminicenantia_JdfR_composite]MCP2598025.1 DUF2905 domain-containing protein [Candidatus Aminicenantes bacterium AC-335-L06]MCP2619067.1 DUF2905 domain-containing protein [Candidatus Aminicenantes bacterium AC-335-A11]